MTAADREAIRRRMTLAKDGPLSVRRELLYEDMPRLLEEVARLQGLLDRQLTTFQGWIDQGWIDESETPLDGYGLEIMRHVLEALRGAIPPSPQEPDK